MPEKPLKFCRISFIWYWGTIMSMCIFKCFTWNKLKVRFLAVALMHMHNKLYVRLYNVVTNCTATHVQIKIVSVAYAHISY